MAFKDYILLSTSPDLDSARKLISEYFFGATIHLEETSSTTWSVSNAFKLLPSFRVIRANGRFRFEVKR